MTRPADIPADVWAAAMQVWRKGKSDLTADLDVIARAILAEREATLDAASTYMTEQYGISALSNPIDRARVFAIRAGTPCQ